MTGQIIISHSICTTAGLSEHGCQLVEVFNTFLMAHLLVSLYLNVHNIIVNLSRYWKQKTDVVVDCVKNEEQNLLLTRHC